MLIDSLKYFISYQFNQFRLMIIDYTIVESLFVLIIIYGTEKVAKNTWISIRLGRPTNTSKVNGLKSVLTPCWQNHPILLPPFGMYPLKACVQSNRNCDCAVSKTLWKSKLPSSRAQQGKHCVLDISDTTLHTSLYKHKHNLYVVW